jgi:hypothetical protein
MAYFQTKNPNLGKFGSVFQWKMFVNFVAMHSISLPFRILYGHSVYFVVILAYFSGFGLLYREKSGSPECEVKSQLRLLGQPRAPRKKKVLGSCWFAETGDWGQGCQMIYLSNPKSKVR